MSTSPSTTIVLITGANSGIGFATAEVLTQAASNYHVIIGSRNAANGTKAADQIQASPNLQGTISSIELEVTDQASLSKAASEIESKFGRLDILINNAGIASASSDLAKGLEETFKVNVIGPALVTAAFRPLLSKSKNPRSVYISSGLASVTSANDPNDPFYASDWSSYRVSKAALNMLVSQERKKDKETGVKTYVMCPGLVRSNLRGKAEQQVSAGGMAGDPRVSGRLVLDIVEGRREGDAERFINGSGTFKW